MRKREEMETPGSTLDKAHDDEPIFILRAQDKLAPTLVRIWCLLAQDAGPLPDSKLVEARLLANEMEAWPNRKAPD